MILKIWLPAIMLFLIPPHSFAQDQGLIDSLKAELNKYNAAKTEQGKNAPSIDDTTAVSLLNSLAVAYVDADPAITMEYANKCLDLAKRIGYKKGMSAAYAVMGSVSNHKGDNQAALEFYQQSLNLSKEIDDQRGIASGYHNLGNVYSNLGDNAQALKLYFAALKINEATGNKNWQALNLINIGQYYEEQENYDEALKFYTTSLQIAERIGSKNTIGNCYGLIGNIHYYKNNYAEALANNLKSLPFLKETGDLYSQNVTYTCIGLIYKDQGKYEDALAQFSQALSIAEEIEDIYGILSCYLSMAQIYHLQKKVKLAHDYLDKALPLAIETDNLSRLAEIYQTLSTLSAEKGDYKQSLAQYQQYITYRDSLMNDDNTRKAAELRMQYDFDKKQVADSLHFAQEKEVGALKLQRQKAITYTGFAGAAITLLFLYLVYQSYQKQRLVNQQLKDAQDQLIKTEKMAAFGIMASRVSHEIMNPLNFVNNFSELSQDIVTDLLAAGDEEEKKENADLLIANLKKIQEHGIRASGIVKQLQEHSLKGSAHAFFEEG